MEPKRIGHAGLVGWRTKAAGAIAPPVAERTPLEEETIRSLLGAAFFVLSVVYVVGTVKRALDG